MKFTTRLAVLFVMFLGLFSMLGVRLWFLQIAEGAEAAEASLAQSWVTVDTPAPRGEIYDRNGVLLASSKFVPAVVVDRHLVKPEQRADLVQRLSAVLAAPPDLVDAMYEEAGVNGRFIVAEVKTTLAYQLAEQVRDLPGVRIAKIPQRVYLSAESMAHVIGHLGLPDAVDLEEDPDLDPDTRIGKLGVERVYDEFLAGTPGQVSYRVERSEIVDQRPEIDPVPGDTVFLTTDNELQLVLENALADGIRLANDVKRDLRQKGLGDEAKNEAVRGAGVVLDAQTGQVLAMASVPSFSPSLFVGRLDPVTYQELADRQAFLNLAVSGLYPPASTFKAITYMAEQKYNIPFPQDIEGVDPASRLVHCDGQLRLPGLDDGSPQIFNDWYGDQDFGFLDEHDAFRLSCNIYFYTLALGAWQAWRETPRENVIQDLARALGFGTETGIDLTGEAAGVIPDRQLYERRKEIQLEDEDAPQLLDQARLEAASPWFGGDLMLTAIGQGDVTSTPLQVAASYAAIANGGRLYRPYVVGQIRNAAGEIVYSAESEVISDAELDPGDVRALLEDMNRVVTRGTASAAFEGFGPSLDQVGGKTGTGQTVKSKDNHAWFAGVAPIDDPRYAVAILIDEGGSGGAVAAPVARRVLQYLLGEELDPIQAGELAD